MKHGLVLPCTFLAALALLLSAAYQLGPQPSALRSGTELRAPAFERADFGLELPLKGSAALAHSQSAPPGPPVLSFRYLRTIGTTNVPYNTGTGGYQYLNDPYGIGVGADGNLYVAESEGMRVLRYDSEQHANLILGSAGIMNVDNTHFSWPGDVLAEADGDFWVADETRITRFNRDGVRQQVYPEYSGCDPAVDILCSPDGLAFDSQGRLYVADGGFHVIQVFTLDYNENPTLWTTVGVLGEAGDDNDHFNTPANISLDSDNNLYVADYGNNRVQKCTYSSTPYPYPDPYPPSTGTGSTGSWSCSTFHGTGEAGDGEDELNGPNGVTVHGSTLYIADSGNGRVKSCDLIGACNSSFITDLENPNDVAVAPDGSLFVSSATPDYIVRRYPSDGAPPVDYAGTIGMPYETAPDKIYKPGGLAVDRSGNVYVSEMSGNRYVKYNSKGALVGSIGTPGINAEFKGRLWGNPGVSASGLLYLPDTNRHCVKIYTTSFVYQNQTIGTCGSPGDSDTQFRNVAGVAVNPRNGNIYVVDAGNGKVKGFTSSLSPLGPLGGSDSGDGDGDYQFSSPRGIAIDPNGNIYVADNGNNRVQKYNNRGLYQYTIGTTGICDFSNDTLCEPWGVATDMLNRVYIADTFANRVQVYDSAGAYLTTIIVSSGPDDADLWPLPGGVVVAPNGTVYVSDWFNHRILVFVPNMPFWR